MKSVVVCLMLAVLAAALVGSTSARGKVRSFCDTATDKVLCAQLTGGATTWEKAMTNALVGVRKRAEGGKSVPDVVAAKLPVDLLPITKDGTISICRENYDRIMYNLEESQKQVKNEPTSLKYTISSISFSDCTDAISEDQDHPVPEATQFHTELLKLDDSLLALAEKGEPAGL